METNMKNIYLLTTLLTAAVFADSGEEIAAANPHYQEQQAESTPFIEYHNRMAVFGPFHQVYERIKPDAFYAGLEAWYLPVWNTTNDIHRDRTNALGEAEFRLGYNFFYNGRDHLTPFIGVGAIRDVSSLRFEENVYYNGEIYSRHHHDERMKTIGYGVIGFLYDHEFNRCVCLGSNLKFLVGGASSGKYHSWGNPVVGFDLSVPLTFRCGYKRHWDFRIEPFDIYLNGRTTSFNYFGFRSTIGYRF